MRSVSATIPMASGGAGAATGTVPLSTGGPCSLRSVIVKFSGAPGTTVVAVADRLRTVLTTPAGNSTRVFNPTEPRHDSAGAAIANAVAGGPQLCQPYVHGSLVVTVTLADPASVVTVIAVLDEDA